MGAILPTALVILGLSFFLDVLDLSFSQALWFVRTLRFWLYFFLHFLISSFAAYLLHTKIENWFLLAGAGTFLGVSVISNTNIKIGGQSIIPIADLFQSIRAKMLEQAADEKYKQAERAALASRLRKLSLVHLETICRDIAAASGKVEAGEAFLMAAREHSRGNEDRHKATLIGYILKNGLAYVEKNIDKWDPPPPHTSPT
jgi:hypothetical protein